MSDFRDGLNRWVIIWAAISSALLVGAASLAFALIAVMRQDDTSRTNARRAECINSVLAKRNASQDKFTDAEIAKVKGQVAALQLLSGTDPAAAVHGFVAASQHYIDVMTNLRADELRHPLGKC